MKPSTVSTVKLWPFWASEPQKIKAALAGLDGFLATRSCLSSDRKTGLAIDESARRVCLMDADSTLITRRLFSYQDLRLCEIIEDGVVIASTESAAGGFQTGARRAASTPGNPGARVQLVALKLVLNDGAGNGKPSIHIVRLLHQSAARGERTHQAALDEAQTWYRLMTAYLSLCALQAPAAPRVPMLV